MTQTASLSEEEPIKLFEAQKRIQPKSVRGFYRRLKWILLWLTLGFYYVAPWIRWNRGTGEPGQAILMDLQRQKFYFFFIEIWPQEIYYIAGLLILGALTMFLMTALSGRVWCGYLCPQTVWTDLFIFVERRVEGDRNARIRLDKAAWSLEKLFKRSVKHVLWLLIALATGGAWVFYFADAPTLTHELFTLTASFYAWMFVGIFTFTTYMLAGFSREQVCTYMCPWPRIQSAFVDDETMLITYHRERGEPKGSLKEKLTGAKGDCIDCGVCVAVCPTGIDIRDGFQLECIQCALCVDACNEVMEKIKRPTGLISYDFPRAAAERLKGGTAKIRLIRPRTLIYTLFITLIGSLMLYGLTHRTGESIEILQDRNPLYVRLSKGGIRNGYTVKPVNQKHVPVEWRMSVKDKAGNVLPATVVGQKDAVLRVPADSMSSFRVSVTDFTPKAAESRPVVFEFEEPETGEKMSLSAGFNRPPG